MLSQYVAEREAEARAEASRTIQSAGFSAEWPPDQAAILYLSKISPDPLQGFRRRILDRNLVGDDVVERDVERMLGAHLAPEPERRGAKKR